MQNNEFIFERENNFKNLSLSKEKLEHNIFNINLIMFGQIHRNKKIFFLPSSLWWIAIPLDLMTNGAVNFDKRKQDFRNKMT